MGVCFLLASSLRFCEAFMWMVVLGLHKRWVFGLFFSVALVLVDDFGHFFFGSTAFENEDV